MPWGLSHLLVSHNLTYAFNFVKQEAYDTLHKRMGQCSLKGGLKYFGPNGVPLLAWKNENEWFYPNVAWIFPDDGCLELFYGGGGGAAAPSAPWAVRLSLFVQVNYLYAGKQTFWLYKIWIK